MSSIPPPLFFAYPAYLAIFLHIFYIVQLYTLILASSCSDADCIVRKDDDGCWTEVHDEGHKACRAFYVGYTYTVEIDSDLWKQIVPHAAAKCLTICGEPRCAVTVMAKPFDDGAYVEV